jgi:hypothetical protein
LGSSSVSSVKTHLGVERLEVAVAGDDQRVNLQHLHVFFEEQAVEVADQGHALLDLLAFQPEAEGDAAAVERLQAGSGIDREGQDFVRGLFRYFLDVHAAFGGCNEGDARGDAVDQGCEVQFALDAGAVFDVNAVDLFAGRSGLFGDKRVAEHLLRFRGGFGGGFGQADAAFFAGGGFLERAFATAASMDLRLDDPDRPVHLGGPGFGLVSVENDAAVGNRHAEVFQQLLRLIFVDVHKMPSDPGSV